MNILFYKNVELQIVMNRYEWEEESSMREHQLGCGWVEMHGFRKFRRWDLKDTKEIPCENWGEYVLCKGNCTF